MKVNSLPSRIIDVGQDIAGVYTAPRVLITNGEHAEYLALSHCWGGDIACKLTTINLDQFASRIPWTILPKNFQDAITVTRRLGFGYIWIDALCILQDSESDWSKESASMEQLYENATITISALASMSSEAGILRENIVISSLPTVVLPMNSEDDGVQQIAVRHDELHDAFEGPLNERGWTLQETILSSRHLFFGEQQIAWKCLSAMVAATGAYSHSMNSLVSELWNTIPGKSLVQDSVTQPARRQIDVLNDYYDLVHEYTGRKITIDKDKLPAFSAVAKHMQSLIKGDYVAGLWSNDFIRGLSWSHNGSSCIHVQRYRAPSWSWAATNDQVTVWCGSFKNTGGQTMEVLWYQVTPRRDVAPFGEIHDAQLFVRGFGLPLQRSSQAVRTDEYAEWLGCARFDEPFAKGIEIGDVAQLVLIDSSQGLTMLALCDRSGMQAGGTYDPTRILPTRYLALLLKANINNIGGECESVGLILREVSASKCIYERRGFFTLRGVFDFENVWNMRFVILI